MPSITLDQFKQCCEARASSDWDALTDALVQSLKDFDAWWQRQSDLTKKWTARLLPALPVAGGALAAFLARLLAIPVAAVAEEFAAFLGALIVGAGVGVGLAVLMDIVDTCGIQNVGSPVA